jgi:hypothetical protein
VKATIMTFGRRPTLVLQPETDAERALLERARSMRHGGVLGTVDESWAGAQLFDLDLGGELDPRYER